MARVLVVDDSEDLLDFFKILLEQRNYTVHTESSFKKVKQKVLDFSPDVILLDVMLSGQDGRTLCTEIRKEVQCKDIPIILISASPDLLKDYEECEAFDAIEKPFNIGTVYKKIEAALQFSHSLNSA